MKSKNLEGIKKVLSLYQTKDRKKMETKSSFLTTESYEITLQNGNKIQREKLLKNRKDGSSSTIIAITEDNKIVVVVEPRTFTKETVGIGFPAGYIEEGEDPKKAALRELKEESGYVPKKIKLLRRCYQDEGCSSAESYIFIALDCKSKYKQQLDQDEYITEFLISFKELDYLVRKGYILGENGIIAYHELKNYLENEKEKEKRKL